ncbi:MAG TPA: hypothetical protein VGF14_05425 [Alphaproteobacteria bacterium]
MLNFDWLDEWLSEDQVNLTEPTAEELKAMNAVDKKMLGANMAAVALLGTFAGCKFFSKQTQMVLQTVEEYSPSMNYLKDNALSACTPLLSGLLIAGVVTLAHKMGRAVGHNPNS